MNFLLIITLALGVASILCLFRVAVGPTLADRVVGLDAFTALLAAILIILGTYYQKDFYLDIAFVYALLAFVGTLAIAKYLEGREIGS
ncbi:MAG: cation:proton antiporter [Clostridia bacterium]|nr:cation:proton antiporter [Clostridia bacterium]